MAEQPKARRRNTREELIKAGVEEINRYGVAGFSMRRIAQLCGVSCGAPYKHFGDRKEFIAAIIDDVNAQWHARQAELLAAYEGDTRKQIVEMSTGYVQFLAENPHLRGGDAYARVLRVLHRREHPAAQDGVVVRPQHPPGHRSGLLTQDERVGRVSDGQYAHDFSLPGVNGLLLCGAEPSGASGERQRCGRAGRQYRFLFHDSRCFCE